jgi:hypothetical protein
MNRRKCKTHGGDGTYREQHLKYTTEGMGSIFTNETILTH